MEKAAATFHKPYSCAQAVYAAFKDADSAKLEELKKDSGGRAEGGRCGALYAAQIIAPESAAEMEREFVAKAGSALCREIKLVHKTPCMECVRIAAEILSKRV